jgi:cytochrome d ubiquinol oxidase subunit I
MSDLLAARSQMALSLGFHILFACAGIGMPALMAVAEGLWLRTGEAAYLDLARRWSRATAILFAVGAVSGTVLSFELGLLWPSFMAFAGPIVSLPFSLEGFAFFFEAIFLGIYLYGWNRVGPVAHWLTGVGVALSGAISGIFVVSANAWMNHPTGYTIDAATGMIVIDPVAAMFNPAMPAQTAHMAMAAYVSTAFLAAGLHAWFFLRHPSSVFHRAGLAVALPVAIVAAFGQLASGHAAGAYLAEHQPAKLAAAEALWETGPRAPLVLGGWPDEEREVTVGALELPAMLSILAKNDPNAVIVGLSDIPRDERPPVVVTHLAYQVMLGLGTAMVATAGVAGALWVWRRRLPVQRPLLWALVALAPAGLIAVEAGWVVTEVGRQPWIIRGVMRTSEAVTPVHGISWTFALHAALYAFLGVVTVLLLRREFVHVERDEQTHDAEVARVG